MTDDWKIFDGNGIPHDRVTGLAAPPPWRDFSRRPAGQDGAEMDVRGSTYQPTADEIEMVNAALYLRRPLLVTGNPGTGKSSLAYAVAHELSLGKVLRWSIGSKSTLNEGLYQYDAISRLRDSTLNDRQSADAPAAEDIGQYLKLGPLGTALYPTDRPRVLLIDEIDKSDIDLPNDLLHVFEEGEYEIPELARAAAKVGDVNVTPHGAAQWSKLPIPADWAGRVRCRAFPFVLMTSNGEREMPPAFFRRCLRLKIEDPARDRLEKIVAAHLGQLSEPDKAELDKLIKLFQDRRSHGPVATDQLLNAVYLVTRGKIPNEPDRRAQLVNALMKELGQT